MPAPKVVIARRCGEFGQARRTRWVNRDKMDTDVAKRASGFRLLGLDTANVIVTLEDNADLPFAFQRYSHSGKLSVIHGYVLDQVPVSQLAALANSANTHRVHLNRPAGKHDALSSVAVNANAVDLGNGVNNPSLYGYTGAGVTVAFIDSGITSYQHPDLADGRVLAFVDFVNGRTTNTTTTVTAPPSPASSAAPGSFRRRSTRGWRRARRWCRSRCSTRTAADRSATSSRRWTGSTPTAPPMASASSICLPARR